MDLPKLDKNDYSHKFLNNHFYTDRAVSVYAK